MYLHAQPATSPTDNASAGPMSLREGPNQRALVAPSARVFKGVNVMRDPYVDGTLTIDGSGLRFIDTSGKLIFRYLPQDIRHITLGITRMSIMTKSGDKFAVSLNAAATLQEVRDEKVIGYSSIAGAATGLIGRGASAGVGASSLADAGRLGKAVGQAEWTKALKTWGFRVTNLDFKTQLIIGTLVAVVAGVALTALALLVSAPR